MEAALTELEAGAIAQQPEAFVGSPQACLFHRYDCHSWAYQGLPGGQAL